jgi:hypothetical protein
VVGQKMRGVSGIVGQTIGALRRENVNIIAIAPGSSECNISFVVAQKDMKAALVTTHREFQLGAEFASLPHALEPNCKLVLRSEQSSADGA